MLSTQAFGARERVQLMPFNHAGEVFDPQNIRCRQLWGNLIEALLCGRQNGFSLLMKRSGEEEEFRVFYLESAASFSNAAFTQNDDLVAAAERIHHDRPFFKR